jgi:hypothetical protein
MLSFVWFALCAPQAHAEAVIEFKTNGPVAILVDGQQATLMSNLRQRAAGLSAGVHQLEVSGMFGKKLYEAEIDLPDNTITYVAWERGEIKVLRTEWLDEAAEAEEGETEVAGGLDVPLPVGAVPVEGVAAGGVPGAGVPAEGLPAEGAVAGAEGAAAAGGAADAAGGAGGGGGLGLPGGIPGGLPGGVPVGGVAGGGLPVGGAVPGGVPGAPGVPDAGAAPELMSPEGALPAGEGAADGVGAGLPLAGVAGAGVAGAAVAAAATEGEGEVIDPAADEMPVPLGSPVEALALPAPKTRTLTVQAYDGMRIEVVHEGHKMVIVVEGDTFQIQDPNGLNMAYSTSE